MHELIGALEDEKEKEIAAVRLQALESVK